MDSIIRRLLLGTGFVSWLTRLSVLGITAVLEWISGLSQLGYLDLKMPGMEWIDETATFVVSIVMNLIFLALSFSASQLKARDVLSKLPWINLMVMTCIVSISLGSTSCQNALPISHETGVKCDKDSCVPFFRLGTS